MIIPDEFKLATTICLDFNATISFAHTGEGSEIDLPKRRILIDLEEVTSIEWFWSLIFHELAHMWCYDNDVYYIYHHDSLAPERMAIYVRKMGFKIEQYVDSEGAEWMKEYFPDMQYMPSYRDCEEDRAFLING